MNSSGSSVTSLVPGGVVTTQNISTVIKPKENNESMKFVKIHEPELSKSAAEQIRVAEESKISKNKIKDEDEAWQENLRGWREKRRQQIVGIHPKNDDQHINNGQENGRKIKTFAQMIEERAKTGNRINYHLQRYIGSDDSEHSQDGESEDFLARNHAHVKNDDDHSSLIHDLNLQDQKDVIATKHSERAYIDDSWQNSPSTKIQQRNQSGESYSSSADEEQDDRFAEEKLSRSHNNNNAAEFDDFDDLAQKPINSTLKQGLDNPPTPPTLHSTDKIKPMLDIEIHPNVKLVSSQRVDDRQSDYDEEEEDEEEEQKHQQRVAFVAKLKAFEQMTQPTTREPKFVPTRPSRQPPKPPKIKSPENILESEPAQQPPSDCQQLPLAPKHQHRQQLKPLEPVASPQRMHSPQHSPRQYPQLSPQLSPHTQPQLAPPEQPRHHSQDHTRQHLLEEAEHSPTPPPSKVDKTTERMSPTVQQQPTAPRHHVQPRQPRSQPLPPNISRQVAHSQQDFQPLLKEDKPQDRTVLSVSGKKRCSSCKEELGRGAAAFVIESLNLVYHTNCFRCSVCHVNLSNGFRGVDVRVHAGALHCQNCYSKDGLNYSRV